MGELIPFRRWRPALPPEWSCHVRAPAFSAAQIRMMIWSGLLLGLILFQAMRYWPARHEAAELPLAALDPYAEARRSKAILEPQEGPPESLLPASERRSPGRSGGPVRVIDGDTFVYAGARIRIADIDTPEVQGRCPQETALAAQATRRLTVLLAEGPFEFRRLSSGRDRDRFGRELRIVTRNGRSLGDVLVAERLARTWTGRREPWCN
jgi:endonuclease YncB( thermonuclease family)